MLTPPSPCGVKSIPLSPPLLSACPPKTLPPRTLSLFAHTPAPVAITTPKRSPIVKFLMLSSLCSHCSPQEKLPFSHFSPQEKCARSSPPTLPPRPPGVAWPSVSTDHSLDAEDTVASSVPRLPWQYCAGPSATK